MLWSGCLQSLDVFRHVLRPLLVGERDLTPEQRERQWLSLATTFQVKDV